MLKTNHVAHISFPNLVISITSYRGCGLIRSHGLIEFPCCGGRKHVTFVSCSRVFYPSFHYVPFQAHRNRVSSRHKRWLSLLFHFHLKSSLFLWQTFRKTIAKHSLNNPLDRLQDLLRGAEKSYESHSYEGAVDVSRGNIKPTLHSDGRKKQQSTLSTTL